MMRQSLTKHLAVLERANLATTRWHGGEKLRCLNPMPIYEVAERWIRQYERPRLDALAQLKREVEPEADQE